MERDPRIDPKPGDNIKHANGTRDQITIVDSDKNEVWIYGGPFPCECLTLEEWRERAKDGMIMRSKD